MGDVYSSDTVSIIVPVYNKKPYLLDCFHSISGQTWHKIEIIAVDDGSTDGSSEVLKQISDQEKRMTVISIQHTGPSAARNAGIRAATGAFITFVDADDMIVPDYIEKLVSSIGDADFCLSGCRGWWRREKRWKTFSCAAGKFARKEYLQNLEKQYERVAGIGWKLYRKAFLDCNSIWFSEAIDHSEDTIFFYRALLFFRSVACINDKGYIIRKHDLNSLTHQRMTLESLNAVLDEYRLIRESAVEEELQNSALRRQMNILGFIGRVCCYQIKRMCGRRNVFFSAAREYNIKNDRKLKTPVSKNESLVRLTLAVRSFSVFYAVTKILFCFNTEKRRIFEEPAEKRRPAL